MKRSDLEAMGIEKEKIDKIMDLHGADIEAKKKEIDTLTTKLSEANGQLNDVQDKLKDVKSKDDEIEKLQKQVDKYVEAEKNRKEKEDKEKSDKELTDKIVAVFGDKEFTSDYVRNGIIADIKKAIADDPTVGIEKTFESLTKDKEGIFKNPQRESLRIPGVHGKGVETSAKDYLDKKYKDNPFYSK